MPTVLMLGYDYAGLVNGFARLGWHVIRGEDVAWYPRAHGNLAGVRKLGAAEYGAMVLDLVREHRVNLVVGAKLSDSNIPAHGQAPPFWHVRSEDIARVKAEGAVFLYVTLDDPDGCGFAIQCDHQRAADAVGTCCVGTRETYKNHGQPHVFEFWPGWDEALRAPTPADAERPIDFLFVGSPYLRPNDAFGIPRRDVVLAAMSLGLRVELYGSGDWLHAHLGGDPSLAEVYKGAADFNRLHELYGRAKLGYSSFLQRGFRYLNDRVPIMAGAGAFCLLEEQLGLEGEFPEGVMVGYHRYRDLDSFRARLAWWASHDAERVQAAARMQRHVLARHTWGSRADLLVAQYESALARRKAAQASCCKGG